MSREVCARLRNIVEFTVRMIQPLTRPRCGVGRQILPDSGGDLGASVSLLFWQMHGCIHAFVFGACVARWMCAEEESRSQATVQGQHTLPAGRGWLRREQCQNMHACNHTNKFFPYKSHLAMDAKYIIMAKTVMLVGK